MKQLVTMSLFDTPVEETTFYKEVFHDGILEGEMRSIDGQIAELTQWHAEGILPADVFQGKVAKLREKHASLAARCKKLAP